MDFGPTCRPSEIRLVAGTLVQGLGNLNGNPAWLIEILRVELRMYG